MSPLIFVLIMEYLTRSLKITMQQPNFRLNQRSQQLKLCFLYFADDLLIFYRAYIASIKGLLVACAHLSRCSSLEANIKKFHIILVWGQC